LNSDEPSQAPRAARRKHVYAPVPLISCSAFEQAQPTERPFTRPVPWPRLFFQAIFS